MIDELEKREQFGRFGKSLNKLVMLVDFFGEIEQILLIHVQKLPGPQRFRIDSDKDTLEVFFILQDSGR